MILPVILTASCFVPACDAPLYVTRSWHDGPTLHACRAHEPLLPRELKDAQAPLLIKAPAIQGSLL